MDRCDAPLWAFHVDLKLTQNQLDDGYSKTVGVRKCLARAYSTTRSTPPGFWVGSWGKGTQVRPPRDIDLMVPLPWEVYFRFEQYESNEQSALLQEVKNHLLATYSATDMRGDGQVVMVRFNTIMIEVVPVFRLDSGQYLMPDANDGGRWKTVDPLAEMNLSGPCRRATAGNCRTLIKMLKVWKRERNVPLKSFMLELIVAHVILTRAENDNDHFWYELLLRDFFGFLRSRANDWVVVPGTNELGPCSATTGWARPRPRTRPRSWACPASNHTIGPSRQVSNGRRSVRPQDSDLRLTQRRRAEIVKECLRQMESCLDTSTSLYEWLRRVRRSMVFLLPRSIRRPRRPVRPEGRRRAGSASRCSPSWPACSRRSPTPSRSKPRRRDDSARGPSSRRCRTASDVRPTSPPDRRRRQGRGGASELMDRMDIARSSSITAPEKYMDRARAKIKTETLRLRGRLGVAAGGGRIRQGDRGRADGAAGERSRSTLANSLWFARGGPFAFFPRM